MAVRAAMVPNALWSRVDGEMGPGAATWSLPAISGDAAGKLGRLQSQRAGLQRYNKTARGSFAVDGAHPIDWAGLGYFFGLLVSHCR